MGALNVFTNDELARRMASDFHVKPARYLNDRDSVRGVGRPSRSIVPRFVVHHRVSGLPSLN
jgi:hypothetical protein